MGGSIIGTIGYIVGNISSRNGSGMAHSFSCGTGGASGSIDTGGFRIGGSLSYGLGGSSLLSSIRGTGGDIDINFSSSKIGYGGGNFGSDFK